MREGGREGAAAATCKRAHPHTRTHTHSLSHPPLPSHSHHYTPRELWALADFLTALTFTEDVREGLALWANGTYKGPQSLRRREKPVASSDGEDD